MRRPASELVIKALEPLRGLKLSSIGYAGDMKTFQFGDLTKLGKRLVGRYAVHVQCPWRIEDSASILVGSKDWYESVTEGSENESSFDPAKGGSLQERVLRELLKGFDDDSRSIVNNTSQLVVTKAEADSSGGFQLVLTGGYRLIVFPASRRQEAWRLFKPGSEEDHFVIVGGGIES